MTGTGDRRKLLFLAFCFPPASFVASVRTGNIAKYLSLAGWDVSVVTPRPTLWPSSEDPDRVAAEMERWGVRMIYTGLHWRCLWHHHARGVRRLLDGIPRRLARMMGIDEFIGWYAEAERACANLQPGDVDVILATGNPYGAFSIAQRLSRRLRCPYVLDYRDLWTGNPHLPLAKRDRGLHIERQVLRDCAAVTVVSPSMGEYLEDRFGVAEKFHVVPNGYAPTDFEDIAATSFGHFAIVYAGAFLPPKRTAEPLMQALRRLAELQPSKPWRFHYYGSQRDYVRDVATAHGVTHLVVLHGKTPRRECLAAIRGAGAAVVITSVDDVGDLGDRGIITGKLFEPVGLGTPVLIIAPPGSDVEAVVRTVGKGAVFSGSQIEEMATFMANLIDGHVPESRQPEAYSWPNLILKLDTVLRQAGNAHASHTPI